MFVGEGAQERSDRTILMPWVKFLWESYCQCLELLRTNARVEKLYHSIANQAFKFCLKYQRKTEFRWSFIVTFLFYQDVLKDLSEQLHVDLKFDLEFVLFGWLNLKNSYWCTCKLILHYIQEHTNFHIFSKYKILQTISTV